MALAGVWEWVSGAQCLIAQRDRYADFFFRVLVASAKVPEERGSIHATASPDAGVWLLLHM